MDMITFAPADVRYLWIATALVLFDQYLLTKLVGNKARIYLHLPWTILHELAHFVMAYVTGGKARITNLIPRLGEDGMYEIGRVEYEGVSAAFGTGLVSIAPMLNLIPAGLVYWFGLAKGENDLLTGIVLLYIVLGLIEAGIPSWEDMRQGHIFSFLALFSFFVPMIFWTGPKAIWMVFSQ